MPVIKKPKKSPKKKTPKKKVQKMKDVVPYDGKAYSLVAAGPSEAEPAESEMPQKEDSSSDDQSESKVSPSNSQDKNHEPSLDAAGRSKILDAIAKRHDQSKLTATQRIIKIQAQKQIEEEKKMEEAGNVDLSKDEHDGLHVYEDPKQISSVLFTCDLLDKSTVLTKDEMTKAVELHLRNMMLTNPTIASIIMIQSLNSHEKREKAIELLLNCLKNIIEQPYEEKYRQIRVSNKSFKEKLASVKGGIEFLRAIGFVEQLQFNAFGGGNEVVLILPEPDESEIDMIEKAWSLLAESADSYSYPLKLYRNPKVFKIDSSKPIPKPEISDDFFVLSSAELQKEQQQRSEDVDKLTTLRTAKMREADAKLQQNNYRYTLIRIRFPNEFILQGVFGTQENFGTVRDFVKEKMANNLDDFTLKDSILGSEQFVDDEKTFYDYGLVPTALFHFEWNDYILESMAQTDQQPFYLDAELEAKAEIL